MGRRAGERAVARLNPVRPYFMLIHVRESNSIKRVKSIISGLEEALLGKVAGDKLKVAIPAEKAYGAHEPGLIQQVPKRAFQGAGEIKAGMRFTAQTEHGPRQVVVTRVAGDMVTIDGNHPLAGQDLNFDVEIIEVRAATAEELEHGHVHGAGGHHH